MCRPVKFLHTKLRKPFFYGACFVRGGIVMLKPEMASYQTIAAKFEAHLSKILLYGLA